MVSWFGGSNFPTATAYPGGVNNQNALITNNTTDIHALLPQIGQGTDDWQRIGTRINPVSLIADFDITIHPQYLNTSVPVALNLTVVMYFLQHKINKDYTTLGLNNNFQQLLDVGDGTTSIFNGYPSAAKLPVARQFYQVLKKVVFVLRSDGQWNGAGSLPVTQNIIANGNSAPSFRRLSVNLTKHLPKTLTYPETLSGTGAPTTLWPTNAAPFWCVGVYSNDLVPPPVSLPSVLQIAYSTRMSFKDM